jgi:hypothetical protein
MECTSQEECPQQVDPSHQSNVVRLDGKLSNAFLMERGVKLGDSLSPLLFISFVDKVLKMCKRRTERTRVGCWNMRPLCCQALLYADDTVLVADSEEMK